LERRHADGRVAQVLLALRGALVEQNRALTAGKNIPAAIQNWLGTAGLAGLVGIPGQGA
jgi:hypothetical protein